MANFNKVLLIGNLTKDPEMRYTPQGTAVVNLRLAVNRKFRNRSQELKEETCFITVVVWDRQAETCNQYLHKGSPVLIEGRLQSRTYEDNSGQKRNVIEVRGERVQFLGAPTKAEPSPEESQLEEPVQGPPTQDTWLEGSEGKADEI